jgi:hypothetical protein
MVQTNAGSVQSEGDVALYTNIVRSKYNVDGSGIVIGILSDSYDCKKGSNTDIQNGNLPSNPNNINILLDLDETTECNIYKAKDEGRAMMQIIHDIAPGATLVFRTGVRGIADFVMGIMELVNQGCNIIVDDIKYMNEPFFQDGIIAQTIDDVVSNGILYFTSIGNDGSNSWDAEAFINSTIVDEYGTYHQFDRARDGTSVIVQFVVLPYINQDFTFVFQWDEPFLDTTTNTKGSRFDVDIFFEQNGFIVASGVDENIGKDPIEIVTINPTTMARVNDKYEYVFIGMLIQLFNGPPSVLPENMKVVVYNNKMIDNFVIFEYGIPGTSTCVGHCNSALGAAVGAASYLQTPPYDVTPPIIQPYSSFGGTPILFDKLGNRLPNKVIRKQPRFVGPDGTLISFSLDGLTNTTNNRFFGTSAAAAHVAAVAALLLQGKGGSSTSSLVPGDIYKLLEDTAIDMDDNSTIGFDFGFDDNTGYGFVNAMALFEKAKVPIPPCRLGCRFRCFLARIGIGNAVC